MALKFGTQVHFEIMNSTMEKFEMHFEIMNSIMEKFEMSDKPYGRHFEFQYGRQDEMFKIPILGSK